MTISVIGCGWLGWPLARRFVELGWAVKGSATSADKVSELKACGISAFRLMVNGSSLVASGHVANASSNHEDDDLFQSDIAILTLPFKRSFQDPEEYFHQIQTLVSSCRQGGCGWIILTSSTSVYPDDLSPASEESLFEPQTERAAVLRRTEGLILNGQDYDGTVIRFAGMYGGERKIGNFLSKRPTAGHGDQPVNLIHQDDCVGVLEMVIRKGIRGEIINAVSDEHPVRRDLYTAAARSAGKSIPVFCDGQDGLRPGKKLVCNRKLKRYGYRFVHPDPLQDVLDDS